jgi:8-oxo-dGTP diphosphatase
METLAIFNGENIPIEEFINYSTRRAVRGVIFDNDNNIALLHAIVESSYYGLPGGGVEEGEKFEPAIIRECKEEIGCDIEITNELGKTHEYAKEWKSINESCGYIGKVVGEKGQPYLVGDENEAEKSSVVEWVSLDEAIHLIETTPPRTQRYSQYRLERDLLFLKKAKELLG